MAEQRPWFKLWVSALSDDALCALSLEDWARWAMLGAHVKMHGEHGTITVRYPGDSLLSTLRVATRGGRRRVSRREAWTSLVATLKRLPGLSLTVAGADEQQSLTITFKNWKKYQEDSSRERMRALRERTRQRDADDRHSGDAHDRHTPPPPCDGSGDGVEERRSRRDSPPPPSSPSPTDRHDWPSPAVKAASLRPGGTRWIPGRYPYAAFHHDCPDPAWRGRCVRADYAAAHPGAYPTAGDDGQPKQCPEHR